MAAEEPVTSPDQRKTINPKAARVGAVLTILVLLAMQLGYPLTAMERIWLASIAGLLALFLIGDAALRRVGLKR
ncbi:MAG TPA: hypothetical protein VFC00_20625 [Micromonosporaceae bacterium]|nr:hypothetical protein [Micromonosporaceae bacterium]